jgi:hypothetical protein
MAVEIDWEFVGKGLLNPTQRIMLEAWAAADKPVSVTGLQRVLGTGKNVQSLSYHCNVLRDRKWIKRAGTRRVRGATEQFWVIAPEIIKK